MVSRGELRFIGVVQEAGKEKAQVHIFDEYCAGLVGIGNFSHLIILYWMHRRDNEENRRVLFVFPRKHAVKIETGVFSCRSPDRPNPIGLCVVELLNVEGSFLTVKGLDAVKGSPIVDIKPYIPRADSIPNAHVAEWTQNGPPT